jgi:hypothetical protein
MLLPSKMEGGDQPARTLPVCLVWGTGGVALGCDESGLFERCIGESNVDLLGGTRRRIKSPTKPYVETSSLYAGLLYLLLQCVSLLLRL